MLARETDHQVAVVHRRRQSVVLLGSLDNVLGVVRHADDMPRVEPNRSNQSQIQKSGVGHGANDAPDVDRVSRFDKHYRQTLEPDRRTPRRLAGNERERLIAPSYGILRFSTSEARRSF